MCANEGRKGDDSTCAIKRGAENDVHSHGTRAGGGGGGVPVEWVPGESAVASAHTLTPSRSELQTRRLMTRPTPVFHFATQLAPLEASPPCFVQRKVASALHVRLRLRSCPVRHRHACLDSE